MDQKSLADKSTEIFKKMLPKIDALINKRIGFTRVHDRDDYRSQAWESIRKAILRFSTEHRPTTRGKYSPGVTYKDDVSQMNLETYCYWYIKKDMDRMADTQEIEFRIYDKRGNYVRTISNSEWRKNKSRYAEAGYEGRSFRAVHAFSELSKTRHDGRETEFEPIDPNWDIAG